MELTSSIFDSHEVYYHFAVVLEIMLISFVSIFHEDDSVPIDIPVNSFS